ncbi:MAG: COX15/CtaA family protein [Dehalococcoidia bacterium]
MNGSLSPSGWSRYQWLTVVTAALTLALIAVGAIVRTTDSGLGCPDWPLCHGRLIPPADQTAIIEYSHRTLAAVVGLLVVTTALVTLRIRKIDTTARALAAASLPLLGLQAWLGKVTVERELPAEVITFHLGTALVLLAVLALLALFAFLGEGRTTLDDPERRTFARIAMVSAAVTAGVLLIGAYVVGSGSTSACTTWPSCVEAPIPFVDGGRETSIHWLHRITVVLGLGAVAFVALAASQLSNAPGVRFGGWVLVGLYVLQIAIGGLNVLTDFSEAALVAHLAVAAAIWATMVLLVVGSRMQAEPTRTVEASRPAPARPGEARAGTSG